MNQSLDCSYYRSIQINQKKEDNILQKNKNIPYKKFNKLSNISPPKSSKNSIAYSLEDLKHGSMMLLKEKNS